jgi:GNAT superfamily N-acetyltransferase
VTPNDAPSPFIECSFVPPSIRTFRNTDVDSICRVWNLHFGSWGQDCHIAPVHLELGCLAKPYFNQQHLLLAEVDTQVIGFAHVAPLPDESLEEATQGKIGISALCIAPHPDEAQVAKALLQQCEDLARAWGVSECRVKPMLPNTAFYLGLGPADSMVGLTSSEQRTCGWIHAAGFQPMRPTTHWELDLTKFHPPVDRLQIQIRRSAHVDRQVDEPLLPWWQACVLGHTEPAAFQLTDRVQRRVLNEVLFWTIAPELQRSEQSITWLWPPKTEPLAVSEALTTEANAVDRLVFLLAESLREFQSEGVDIVRTVSPADDCPTSQLLKRLSFKPIQSGVVFHKLYPAGDTHSPMFGNSIISS